MSTVLSRIPVRMLSDVLSTRALERIIQDAAEQRRVHPAQLNAEALQEVLKRDIYHRLQIGVPAQMAKQRVQEVLAEVNKVAEEMGDVEYVPADLSTLEAGVKKFTLYFDWPESQRLRGVLNMARKEEVMGNDVTALIEEGEGLVDQMERRLAEGLVAQGQELAELKASFERVSGVGGREVRRLETLIEQLDDAQKQDMLLPGELERARKLSLKLRKKLESSVIKDTSEATQESQAKAAANIRALELEHAIKLLGDVMGEFGPLISSRPELEAQARELENEMAQGTLTEEAVTQWQADLSAVRSELRSEQEAELQDLQSRLSALPDSEEASKARMSLGVAEHTLQEGGYAGRELRDLSLTIRALESAPEGSSEAVRQQRELSALERSAREVPGAWEEMQGRINEAREAVAQGGTVDSGVADIDALYTELERFMGRAAQERAELDKRADYIVDEYDTVRDLAGETTQKLGRLADTLRAQRRLGQLSAKARDLYVQTLEEAESLLDEARAEYAAAQEVTATFGEDALSSLLDVFNLGEEGDALGGVFDVEEGDGLDGSDLLVQDSSASVQSAEVAAETDMVSDVGTQASQSDGAHDPFGFMANMGSSTSPQPQAEAGEEVVEASVVAEAGVVAVSESDLPDASWIVQEGRVQAGPDDLAAQKIAGLLEAAARLGIRRLRFDDNDWTWGAQKQAGGEWRLTRANDAASLELGDGGSWLKG